MADISITIKLPGTISGMVRHTKKQNVKIYYPDRTFETRKILHTDRTYSSCSRRLKISNEVVKEWCNGECPNWERPSRWKSMNTRERLNSHVQSFDEGFGVSYEEISN